MYTLGYSFNPWKERKSIADGPSILKYVNETASQFGIDKHIVYNIMIKKANFSTDKATWVLEGRDTNTNEVVTYSCNFLMMATGYYDFKEGFTPIIPGMESFKGTIVHPQSWPEDLDYKDKEVVVIGSGATASELIFIYIIYYIILFILFI
jgi:cation diffusion facilitator CzcD-associated flavoprotein CzcO